MATKARQMVLNRDYVLTSKFGHSLKFDKGEPRQVPPILYGEVLAIGGEFADGGGAEAVPEKAAGEPLDNVERDQRIYDAIKQVAEANDVDEFTAAGIPKADAVAKRAGFKVSNKDVAKAWQKRADNIAETGEA